MAEKKGIVILQKGSQEAKDYMAKLRALRKPKTTNETTNTKPQTQQKLS